MDLMKLRRLLIQNGTLPSNIPQLVIQYELTEDFLVNASTTLTSIDSNEIQTFFDTYCGIRGQYPVGTFKLLHIDVKSDVPPTSNYSYITHFWYDEYLYYTAQSQRYSVDTVVVVPQRDNHNALISNSPLYTLRPVIGTESSGKHSISVVARTSSAPFDIWKAGVYTFTISYLGEVIYND